jgi:hypothetical protein
MDCSWRKKPPLRLTKTRLNLIIVVFLNENSKINVCFFMDNRGDMHLNLQIRTVTRTFRDVFVW